MKIFGGRFKTKAEPFKKQAQNLVQAAKLNAISTFTPLLERYPILEKADIKNWDFILTVAGVFVAVARLSTLMGGSEQEQHLLQIITKAIEEWDRDGLAGFEDCQTFFVTESDRLQNIGWKREYLACDAIGLWVFWNVLNRQPQIDEFNIIRTIGDMILIDFDNWWQE
jgi:hypothetical protein